MNSPHPFQPNSTGPVGKHMCRFCSRWDDDPLHVPLSVPDEKEESDG